VYADVPAVGLLVDGERWSEPRVCCRSLARAGSDENEDDRGDEEEEEAEDEEDEEDEEEEEDEKEESRLAICQKSGG